MVLAIQCACESDSWIQGTGGTGRAILPDDNTTKYWEDDGNSDAND